MLAIRIHVIKMAAQRPALPEPVHGVLACGAEHEWGDPEELDEDFSPHTHAAVAGGGPPGSMKRFTGSHLRTAAMFHDATFGFNPYFTRHISNWRRFRLSGRLASMIGIAFLNSFPR